MRGSDPNAAVYWLWPECLMGERILSLSPEEWLFLASEDIGLANPNALLLATTTMDAIHDRHA